MSSTLLDVTRAAHEEVERPERLVVKDLETERPTSKDRLFQSHCVRNMIDSMTSTTEKLVEIYEDKDNARKDEIAALGGQNATGTNVFSALYDRLKDSSVTDDRSSDLTASFTSSVVDAACANGKTNSGELVAYNLPTTCYSYYYPGSNVVFSQTENNGLASVDDSLKESRLNDCSYVYYMPGYNSYATGSYMGYDGQAYHAPSYGPEAGYSWDSTYAIDLPNGSSSQTENPMPDPKSAVDFSGSTHVKSNANVAGKLPLNRHAQAFRPLSKGNEVEGLTFSKQRESRFPCNLYMKKNSNGRFLGHRDRYTKPDRSGEFNASVELTCGPRAHTKGPPSNSPAKGDNLLAPMVNRDKFNLPDFQIEYEDAKFFIIKSYSEDDIHKSVKYSVWSSTPNGNKKLDAAFREAEAKSREDGKKRPIFLFFSVNSSRQFVGLAEMVGYVDFDKDLEFWQVDKWTGFLPVQWHVIKDIPNRELRHIILENNENRPVTHTRDTHEVTLKEGLEMLAIFKNFFEKSSLLDDFGFYEERENSLRSKKEHKPATLRMDFYKDRDFEYDEYEMYKDSERMRGSRDCGWTRRRNDIASTSLVGLTKNLSLKSCSTSKSNSSSKAT